MPKINTKLQSSRVNRRNTTNKIDFSTSELISGLKAEHIPLPDTQCIKRVLENSRKSKSKNDPPRPPNAFFLFRSALHSHLASCNLRVPQVSMAAGELWGSAGEEIKSKYTKLQEIAKVLHLEMHPGYVYRPRKTFPPPPTPLPLNINTSSSSSSSVKQSNLKKDNSSKRMSFSISKGTKRNIPRPERMISSRLTQLSVVKHNRTAEKLQMRLPSLTKPNPSTSSNNNNNNHNNHLYEIKNKHNDKNQQIFTNNNNNTSQISEKYSQQQQRFIPMRLIRYLPPVQNHNIRYHNINNHFIHNHQYHQFTPQQPQQQQQNQTEPILITTLTSITALPIINSNNLVTNTTPNLNFVTQNNMNSNGRGIPIMLSQQSVNGHHRYNSFNFGNERGNETFNWVNY